MEQVVTSNFKLGIIAGGQLGKMLVQAASTWDIKTYVLDPDDNCPCADVCSKLEIGSWKDFDAVYRFGQMVDVLTYEVESINIEALYKLKAEGKEIYPDPDALAIIQDKGLQKQFYQDHDIQTSAFTLFDNKSEVLAAIAAGQVNVPCVQKARTGGYDGRGVQIIKAGFQDSDILDGPTVIEDKVDIDKEISVICHRGQDGSMSGFEPVEMEFDPISNLVELLVSPAHIDSNTEKEAIELAERVIEQFGLVGTLAVELFLDKSGKLWVNEVAPRPHNSGHHTIESAITSQYEQHLRAVLGMPLGSTDLISPSTLVNLVGHRDFSGPVRYEGLEEVMAIPGARVHLYGKKETRPDRKMGHVTILAPTIEKAKEKAELVKKTISVKAWEPVRSE